MAAEHLFRRPVPHAQPVRLNPYPQVSVLPGVRHRCHSSAGVDKVESHLVIAPLPARRAACRARRRRLLRAAPAVARRAGRLGRGYGAEGAQHDDEGRHDDGSDQTRDVGTRVDGGAGPPQWSGSARLPRMAGPASELLAKGPQPASPNRAAPASFPVAEPPLAWVLPTYH
jgi:hypothetical protein